jgi:hypothetical protein
VLSRIFAHHPRTARHGCRSSSSAVYPPPVLTPPWLYTSKAVLQSRETPSAGIWNLEGQRRAREGGKKHLSCPLCPRLHGPLPTTVAHSCQLFQPSREKRVRLVKRTVVGALGDVRHTVRVSRREKRGGRVEHWTSVSKPYPSISTTHNKNHDDPIQTSSIRLRHAIWDKEV